MNVLVPKEEIVKLKELIIETFNAQQDLKILFSSQTLYFKFIAPRNGSLVCAEIRTLLPDRHLKIRVYITDYNHYGHFGKYKIEQIINTDNGIDDYVYVNIAILPQAYFPILRALSYPPPQIPDFEQESVPNPKADGRLSNQPLSKQGGTLNYLTTPPYPVQSAEQITNSAKLVMGGTLNLLTTPLYPVRGNELFQSKAVISDAKKYRPPILNEGLDISSLLEQFILGINPYSGNSYYYTPENGRQFEELSISGVMNLFTLIQTYFPVTYTLIAAGGEPSDSFSITSAVMDQFILQQTYFPVTYTIIAPTSAQFEAFNVSAVMNSFTLA